MTLNFEENKTYIVHRLHYIDTDGNEAATEGARVRFTTGWACVTEESSQPYVIPREKIIQADGLSNLPAQQPATIEARTV